MPEIAETAHGPIEYDDAGTGAPVLVVHGSPGGWDQGRAMASALPPERFRTIAVSRPGYLATALEGRERVDAQADLFAALLDTLEVERAGVLCWSGGGPSGYRLAVRHPERVRALVALAAVSQALPRPREDLPTRLLFTTGPGDWLLRAMAAHAPKQLISSTLASEGDLTKAQLRERTEEVFTDERKRRFVLDLDATVRFGGDRKAGLDNDYERFGEITTLELERIAAPCLLVHGSADTDVPPPHSQHAAAAIPGAELVVLDGGTHLAFYTHPDSDVVQARAAALLSGG
jgi:pimeloyl-ACP methyl ester carboxylesterase